MIATTATTPTDINTRIADRLEAALGPRRYEMWFKRSAKFAFNGDDATLKVTVPSKFAADWIGRNFGDTVADAARAAVGSEVRVDLSVEPAAFDRAGFAAPAPAPTASAPHAPASPAAVAALVRADRASSSAAEAPLRHRLEDFIVGPSNQLAHAAASRLAADDAHPGAGHAAAPVFLHGSCGLGKTHLLQGACAAVLQRNPKARVLYTTGEQFTNDYITAVRTNKLDAFRKRVRSLDLLAVDDVHFIANKQATQQEFLHSFDQIELGGAKVILASDCHPKLIKQFSEALVSRCVRGMVVQVHKPDAFTRLKLVEALAQRRGLRLADTVAQALAERCDGSVREIEGTLTKLSALMSLTRSAPGFAPASGSTPGDAVRHQGLVGHAILRQLFDGEATTTGRPRRPVRFETILSTVTAHLGVPVQQVTGRSRHANVVLARAMTIHLARQLTSMSYPEIAAALGRPNHSTVITAAQRVTKQLAADEPMVLTGVPDGPLALRPSELVEQLRRAVVAAAD